MRATALITGINGQDGSYLAELLLAEGWEVHGTIRRASMPNLARLEPIRDQLHLHWADLSDGMSLVGLMKDVKPRQVYNLGAMSDVRVSFDVPVYAGDVDALGAARVLEAVRIACPDAAVYQAGSSEMFGMNPDVPCDETSAFHPGSPYAVAKVYAYHIARNYREAHGMHVSNGILFNHESERRGVEFVTRKITLGVAEAARNPAFRLKLGSLAPKRDWGHAEDYVRAMYLMTTADKPGDYVVATGETHSVREFAQAAFDVAGLDWRKHVDCDTPDLLRPTDPPVLLGNPAKIRKELGWKPVVRFRGLVERMIAADLGLRA